MGTHDNIGMHGCEVRAVVLVNYIIGDLANICLLRG